MPSSGLVHVVCCPLKHCILLGWCLRNQEVSDCFCLNFWLNYDGPLCFTVRYRHACEPRADTVVLAVTIDWKRHLRLNHCLILEPMERIIKTVTVVSCVEEHTVLDPQESLTEVVTSNKDHHIDYRRRIVMAFLRPST